MRTPRFGPEPGMEPSLAAVDGPQELHGRKLALVFAGLMLVMLMAALDATIVATALPTIAGDLGGLNHISWVTTAYLLAQTVVTPLYGKLGDQFGRRIVLQVGLVIFLVGSALCGLSHTFPELIAFRALQGLGGGGLTVSAQAAIGDVVPPRQRGRYQGLFGAVFGLATVIGPLLGGALTTNLSWRWIFYINLPIGILALFVLAVTFPSVAARTRHRIDYTGTALLALALAALVLAVSLGGTTYPWGSVQVIGLFAVSLIALGGFVLAERRAAEPVLPLKLLRNQVFVTTGIVAVLLGFAMFGTITFLPLYFQVVKGASPTGSGLDLLPLMAGLLITSIVGGQIVSRTGRYRAFPIVGTAIMTIGLFLLSRLSPETSTLEASAFMFVTGFGIGLVMQVLVVAVQNAVDYQELGVATSGNTLFRNIGSSVGTAIIGTIFATELASRLRADFPHASASQLNTSRLSAASLTKLPPAIHETYLAAYASSLDTAFKVAGFVSIAAFIASWFIRELPMRTTLTTEDLGSAFGAPSGGRLAFGDPPGAQRPGRPTADAPMAPTRGRRSRLRPSARRRLGAGAAAPRSRSRPGGAGRQSEDRAFRPQWCGRRPRRAWPAHGRRGRNAVDVGAGGDEGAATDEGAGVGPSRGRHPHRVAQPERRRRRRSNHRNGAKSTR